MMTMTGQRGGGRGGGRGHGGGRGRGRGGRGGHNRFFRRGVFFRPATTYATPTYSPSQYWWWYLQQMAYLNQLQAQPTAAYDSNLVETIQELIEEINELQGALAANGIVVQRPAAVMQQPTLLPISQQQAMQPVYQQRSVFQQPMQPQPTYYGPPLGYAG